MARTIIGTSPWPVMKMIGMHEPRRQDAPAARGRSDPEGSTSSTRQLGAEQLADAPGIPVRTRMSSACHPAESISSSSALRTELSSSTTNTIGSDCRIMGLPRFCLGALAVTVVDAGFTVGRHDAPATFHRYHVFLLETGACTLRHDRRSMTDHSPGFVIAVVDDDQRVLESLENLLDSADYAVRSFASGDGTARERLSSRDRLPDFRHRHAGDGRFRAVARRSCGAARGCRSS